MSYNSQSGVTKEAKLGELDKEAKQG